MDSKRKPTPKEQILFLFILSGQGVKGLVP
jgi:hypothetical protein